MTESKRITKRKCCKCGTSDEKILLSVTGVDGEISFCPNHIVTDLEKALCLRPMKGKCDGCNDGMTKDVYIINTTVHEYTLCKKHLIDLVCLCLDRQSYTNLKKKTGEEFEFYIHDDFYWKDGTMLQPEHDIAQKYYDFAGISTRSLNNHEAWDKIIDSIMAYPKTEKMLTELRDVVNSMIPGSVQKHTEAAYIVNDGQYFIAVQKADEGYDYTIYNSDMSEYDGGQIDDLDMSLEQVAAVILTDEFSDIRKISVTDYDRLVEIAADAEMRKAAEQYAIKQVSKFVNVIDARVYTDRYRDPSEPVFNVLVEYEGDMREDDMFNALHEDTVELFGMAVDINPIKKEKSGTIESYLKSLKGMEGLLKDNIINTCPSRKSNKKHFHSPLNLEEQIFSVLSSLGGSDGSDEWSKGWDEAIGACIDEISKIFRNEKKNDNDRMQALRQAVDEVRVNEPGYDEIEKNEKILELYEEIANLDQALSDAGY